MPDMPAAARLLGNSLEGRVAIVTGGGRDIGRACALRLAEAGAAVAINYYNSASGAESAVDEIEAAGGRALAVRGDMTSGEDVASLIAQTRSAFGERIDILVHVTGGLVARKTLAEMDLDHWNTVMDLNATSFLRAASLQLKHTPAPEGHRSRRPSMFRSGRRTARALQSGQR